MTSRRKWTLFPSTLLSLPSCGRMTVHVAALTLTGLVVRSIDPMRTLMKAARADLGEDPQEIILLTNNAMMLGLNASLLGGVFAERAMLLMRPKLCVFLGHILWALGWSGLLQKHDVFVYLGAVALGLAFPAILHSILFLTALLSVNTLGLSILSTSADISTSIPLLLAKSLNWFTFHSPKDVRRYLLVYIAVSTVVSAFFTLCVGASNRKSTSTPLVYSENPETHPYLNLSVDDGPEDPPSLTRRTVERLAHGSLTINTALLKQRTSSAASNSSTPYESTANHNVKLSATSSLATDLFVPQSTNEEATLYEKLQSPNFWLFALFFSFNILRMTHWLCWNRATLEAANKDSESGLGSVDVTMDIHNITIIFAFIPGFLWGATSDIVGSVGAHCLLNFFGTVATYTTTLPHVFLQRLGVLSFVVHQSFVFSSMFCFLTDTFGFRDLAFLQGVLALCAVIPNIFLAPWGFYVIDHLKGDWVFVGRAFSVVGVTMFIVPLIHACCSKPYGRRSSDDQK